MDTAKVDIRKLQLLNDRINQCIDALNQVRLSVHGLSHTSLSQPVAGMSGMHPMAQNPAFGSGAAPSQNPLYLQGYGVVPQGNPWAAASPWLQGLSHTAIPSAGAPIFLASPPGTLPVPIPGAHPLAGLSHSSAEAFEAIPRPVWTDPVLSARIAQTFPYAYVSVPPVVTIY